MTARESADLLAAALASVSRLRDAATDETARALLASAAEDTRQALETVEDVAIREHIGGQS